MAAPPLTPRNRDLVTPPPRDPVTPDPADSRAHNAAAAGRGERLSIVLPFFNEEESVEWVLREISDLYPRAEIIAVDDGSTDGTWERLAGLRDIVALRLRHNRGQSAAIYTGLRHATRPLCSLLDGDGQNDPADIGRLVEALQDADVACGYREVRRDNLSKRFGSRVANAVRRMFLDDGVRDTGCALKVFDRRYVDHLVPFDGLHRFLPAIFNAAGLRIVEVPVNHRTRRYGASKYTNLSRALRGLYDLVGVSWLLRRKIRFPDIETADE
jgi:dolichol-phosphate mannosyltransferase